MKTVRSSLAFAIALPLTMGFSSPQRAMAWDCVYTGGGGGGNWSCVDGNGDVWFVDCTGRVCVYQKVPL